MIEINYSTMKITVILLALSLLCLFSCKDKKVKEELTTQKVEVVEVAKPEPVAPPKEEPKPVVKQVNYYLVAGCFKIPENAERLQAKLIQEGYDSRIVPFYNMSMVTYDGYETRKEAQVALNRIVREPGKERTWVYPTAFNTALTTLVLFNSRKRITTIHINSEKVRCTPILRRFCKGSFGSIFKKSILKEVVKEVREESTEE